MFSHEKSKPLQEALDVLDPKKETKPAKCNCSNSIITSLSITKSEFCTLRKQPTITVADVSFFGSYVHLADETDCFFHAVPQTYPLKRTPQINPNFLAHKKAGTCMPA